MFRAAFFFGVILSLFGETFGNEIVKISGQSNPDTVTIFFSNCFIHARQLIYLHLIWDIFELKNGEK